MKEGHLKIVELLQDKRVDPTANNNYVLHIAKQKHYVQIVVFPSRYSPQVTAIFKLSQQIPQVY
jgi:hypothetical protein